MKWTKQELEWLEKEREVINTEDIMKIKAEISKYDVSFQVKVLLCIAKVKGFELFTEFNRSLVRLYMYDERKHARCICSTNAPIEGFHSNWTRKKIIELWEKDKLGIDMSEFITEGHGVYTVG